MKLFQELLTLKRIISNMLIQLSLIGQVRKRSAARAWKREQRAKEAITCLKLTGHNPKSGVLLDLGCGLGYLTRYFSKLGIKAVGVDISRGRIKFAKEKVLSSGSFILADGVKLPFREGFFNTVVLNDVLEHVPYNLAKPMLNEVERMLKASGKLYISVESRYMVREGHSLIPFLTWFPRPCWDAIYKLFTKRSVYPFYPYTIGKLKRVCSETNLTCTNYTWFYAWNKMSNVQDIGDPTLKKIVKMIRRLKLSKPAHVIAEKVSLILFICEK